MARQGDYRTVQPTKASASGKDLEVDFLVPIADSELAQDVV
ncbi:Uncharacterised protein [Mycobacteroides abscessus subsp. abscessus]|nr:Uncharacterised protein [Mycobacteroides abscessus]SHQ64525.1 Uncharacterised protein [Mycobacteroides abscessus subsp. abscessus]SHR32917.1 Uncharacterised protein [Mycobacteroides abscessus subsp. abscessus]SHZ30323.1 Uncharacterised protein [Mycobacteroides abscessus subsp. abscessus]SKE49565.1 Uncharacterised protein [Mycobacteroides abscessus subsp. abscessus]